jgi:hypothetical protein
VFSEGTREMDGAWHWVSCLGKRPSRRSETDLDIIMSRMKVRPPGNPASKSLSLYLSQWLCLRDIRRLYCKS